MDEHPLSFPCVEHYFTSQPKVTKGEPLAHQLPIILEGKRLPRDEDSN